MFRWRDRVGFLHSDRGLQRTMGAATAMASARNLEHAEGTDSLDLLVAATDARPVARLLEQLGLDRQATVRRAIAGRVPVKEPGLTIDAKRVVEAVGDRALNRQRNPTPVDLFVALATTPGPARDVLLGLGLDEGQLLVLTT